MLALLLSLLLLRPALAGRRVPTATQPAPVQCAVTFRVGFLTDVTGLDSSVDAQGWAGAQRAAGRHPCIDVELLRSSDPGSYQAGLELLAERDDLVIAGSLLLTDAVSAAAADRAAGHFILVDPLVMPTPRPNLAVISFREDQAGFLAGALAAMVSRTKVLGGVYGPEGGAMTRYRQGFETGAATVDPATRVLGAYQPAADGRPFGNAEWGQEQAHNWLARGADVIFGAGGSTGEGSLLPAAASHSYCIGSGDDEFLTFPTARSCLLTSAMIHTDRAVETAILSAADGRFIAGSRVFGVADGAVGLAPFHQFDSTVSGAMRARLSALSEQLSLGEFLNGN